MHLHDLVAAERFLAAEGRIAACFERTEEAIAPLLRRMRATGRTTYVTDPARGVIWGHAFLKPPYAPSAEAEWFLGWGLRFPDGGSGWNGADPKLPCRGRGRCRVRRAELAGRGARRMVGDGGRGGVPCRRLAAQWLAGGAGGDVRRPRRLDRRAGGGTRHIPAADGGRLTPVEGGALPPASASSDAVLQAGARPEPTHHAAPWRGRSRTLKGMSEC